MSRAYYNDIIVYINIFFDSHKNLRLYDRTRYYLL